MGKGENTGNQRFSLLPTMFSTLSETRMKFSFRFLLVSANSLNVNQPDDKISDWSELKAFADDKFNITQMLISVFARVENVVGRGENAGNQLLFSHNVKFINSFQNKPLFLRVCSINLLETMWEKEKLLVTSNFSFSHSVFYPLGKLSAIFVKVKIVVCKLF